MTAGPLRWFRDVTPRPGSTQMRIDREFLRRAPEEPGPWLRFYTWSPPAVSLGYHQDPGDLDAAALAADGIDLVVRPTGGSAVLHHRELTYVLAGRRDGPFGATLSAIYDAVAEALVEGLRDRGLPAARGGGGRPEGVACFADAGGHEVTLEGRKLVGSACRLTRDAFLVHGSILTGPQHRDLPRYLAGPEAARRPAWARLLRERTTDLGEWGIPPRGLDDLAAAIAAALGRRAGGARGGAPPEWWG